jgi:hypothetical protein
VVAQPPQSSRSRSTSQCRRWSTPPPAEWRNHRPR